MKAQLDFIQWSNLASNYHLFVRWTRNPINGLFNQGNLFQYIDNKRVTCGTVKVNKNNPLQPLYIIELDDSILD